MSSKPAEPRAIASQLVLLFTLAACLLLVCGLGALYLIVVHHAFEEDNAVLADRVSAIRADLHNAAGPAVLQDEVRGARAGEKIAYWVRVQDHDGRTIAETPTMSDFLPTSLFPEAQSAITAGATKNIRRNGRLLTLLSTTEEVGGQRYTLQIAQDRSVDDQFTRNFAALLAIILALGVIAAAAIAVTVTKRGLRPLAEMTRSLQRVGPTHLHERVPLSGWPRELQPLAAAFDDMLDRLEDSFTRLSQFSADLAHELRTPIANLRGEAEVALTRPRTPAEYRAVIESSVAECERLSGIIDNLLFLARADAAEGHIERTQFDGRAAIEKIAAYYQAIAEERHVAITCSGNGKIDADQVLFGRAVSNLVDNALRFTPDGGAVAIEVRMTPTAAEVSVRDNGSGIASEHLPRVFDRFYRADSSRSSMGTGLGLALVKSIADLHGGSARVRSEVGSGTTVTLVFPAPDGREQTA